jgi:hypothetical protein
MERLCKRGEVSETIAMSRVRQPSSEGFIQRSTANHDRGSGSLSFAI